MTSKEREALNKFLLDIDCLSELSKWQDDFNIFEILKVSRTEIRHSNVLAWLLNPTENHGLGDKMLQGVFQYLAEIPSNINESIELMTMDNYSFSIRREWSNIDILVVSEKEKCVICFENKIDSKENKGTKDKVGQLKRYKKIIEEEFAEYKSYYIFLTPNGEAPSDTENWTLMDYNTILDIISRIRKISDLSKEAEMLIDNYISLLRRRIVKDQALVEICNKIYLKHRKALDLIFENKTDQVVEACSKWLQGKGIEPCKETNTSITFVTKDLDEVFPTAQSKTGGAWGNGRLYYFEIKPNRNDSKVKLKLVFDLTIENENRKEFINKKSGIKPTGNKFFTAFSETFEYDDGFSEKEWFDKLDEVWRSIQNNIKITFDKANIKYTKS